MSGERESFQMAEGRTQRNQGRCKKGSILVLVVCALVSLAVAITLMHYATNGRTGILGGNMFSGFQNPIMVGKIDRNDAQICNGNAMKKTFPDLDYATYGYNIIYGYPLAIGHDPGLRHPLFETDYSQSLHTADCRYHVPLGYHLVPDVACVTSFSSETITSESQLSKSLSVSAEASGGGWGVQFSASAEYKDTSSSMSSSKNVVILSSAKCNYYFAMLDEKRPPALSKSFIETVKNMKDVDDAYALFKYYGTHFQTYTLFGARFTYYHKMSQSSFATESQSSVSVSVKASYSGLFSLSGGFGMDSSQSKMAKEFLAKVETSTISIGAPPPATGNAMQWASTVKETPIPVKYKLKSIDNLFTKEYFKGTGIDYEEKKALILKGKAKYCQYLRLKGIVKWCSQKIKRIVINGIKLTNQNKLENYWISSREECYSKCLNHYWKSSLYSPCFALSASLVDRSSYIICTVHGDLDRQGKGAVIVDPNKPEKIIQLTAEEGSGNSDVIISTKSLQVYQRKIRIMNLKVRSTITSRNHSRITSEENCLKICDEDPLCSVVTYRLKSVLFDENCWTYFDDSVTCDNDESSTGALRARRNEKCQNMFLEKGFATTFMP